MHLRTVDAKKTCLNIIREEIKLMITQKPKILITFSEGGQNGGPYLSHLRISESELKKKYNFVPLFVPRIRKLLNPIRMYKFVKSIKSESPDIVHCAGLQMIGFLCVVACKLARVKNVVIAIHGSNAESLDISKSKKEFIKFLESKSLKLSSYHYGVSQYVINLSHIKKYKDKCYGVIFNLPHETFIKDTNYKSIRKELKISEDDVIIVSTGRITYEKGYSVLAEALMKANLNTNVKVLIVGDGSYLMKMKSILKKMVDSNQVYFLGYRKDIDFILSESDIFVLCTLHETLSNATIEAGKQGLPSIVSNIGGLPEIIIDRYNGILVPINKSQKFANALIELVDNEKTRKTMGENAKKIIEEKFSKDIVLEKIDDLYRTLLSK